MRVVHDKACAPNIFNAEEEQRFRLSPTSSPRRLKEAAVGNTEHMARLVHQHRHGTQGVGVVDVDGPKKEIARDGS